MGKTNNDAYLTPFYVSLRNDQDMLMPNHEPLLQKGTNFSQFHAAQKIYYKASESVAFDLGLHFATTSNIPRYDRLTLMQSENPNTLQFSEWNYGPQQWFLANFQLTKLSSRSPFYDKIKSSLAYQNFEESRIIRKFEANDRKTRTETVEALSLNLDLEKSLSDAFNLSYGAEFIHNKIGSVGISKDIETNTIQYIASRYPDGGQWLSFASYLSFKYKPSSKLTFQSGIRYNDISIATDLTPNNEYYDLPFTTANLQTSALTGTAGFTWEQSQTFLWKFNLTTAFRAPNIDDIGKVFDSEPGSVVVPNNQLKPEHAYGGELGLSINFNDSVLLDLSTYYTHLDNAMTRDAFNINGVTEINYDGVSSAVQAVQNNAQANIYGFEAGLKAKLTKDLQLTSQFSLTKGRQKNTHNLEGPIRHVAPAFGNAHLLWTHKKITLDGFINYSAGLTNKDISHELSNHLFAIDANGSPYAPAWMTFNIRAQYQFSNTLSFVSALENISNEGYRPFASGISAPGTHLIFAITYKN
jgi:hemoglobin/transferrin/lactoferrin receptor protein